MLKFNSQWLTGLAIGLVKQLFTYTENYFPLYVNYKPHFILYQ